MAESTNSISRVDIKVALRRKSSYALTGTLSTDQNTNISDAIKYGENMFYRGTRLPGETTVHPWSFLNLEYTVPIIAADDDYDLPDGFGGVTAPYLSYDSAVALNQVQVVGLQRLNELRSFSQSLTSEWPTHAAISSKAIAQSTGQRFHIELFPMPSATRSLLVPYRFNPDVTADATPYQLGGQPHGMTLLNACLAAWEIYIEDERNGPCFQEFMRLMVDSVDIDRALTTPQHFGRNEDHSRDGNRSRYRRHGAEGVEYVPGF